MMQGGESWTLSDLMGVHTYVLSAFLYSYIKRRLVRKQMLSRSDPKGFQVFHWRDLQNMISKGSLVSP